MVHKRALLCFCIALMLLTTGCWSKKELNELAIVVAMGIDKVEDQYRVSIQVVEPEQVSSQKGGGGRAPVTTYQSKADTVFEALRKLTVDIPRKPFLAHIRMLIIDEELAKGGISDILDTLSRENEFRTNFYIVIARETTGLDVLSISTELEKIPANTMYDALKTSENEWAPTKSITLDRLINNLTTKGKHPVITGIKVIGNVEIGKTRENVDSIVSPAYLIYTNLAVFKGDRLQGWLNTNESKGYNYISGHVKRTTFHIPCPSGGHITIETKRTKVRSKGSMKNGKPQVDLVLRGDAVVGGVACNVNLKDPETIVQLEKEINKLIEKGMKMAIQTAQKKFNSDIFGFGQMINRADPKAWKSLQNDWDQLFAELPVTVKSTMKIRNLGSINNSFIEDMKSNQ